MSNFSIYTSKNSILSLFFLCLSLIFIESRADLVFAKGDLVGHTNGGGLTINNPSTLNSVFLTSDQSHGYQAEITKEATKNVLVGTNPTSLIECQQPFGNPVACASGCTRGTGGAYAWGTTICNPGVVKISYSPTPGTDDTLNEQSTHSADLDNYVYLDTIVNQSPATFDIAVTDAPLFIPATDAQGNVTPDPKSIAGGLYAGTSSIFDDIYTNKKITLGGTNYSVNFLTTGDVNPDGRFTVYPASHPNATKKHMASPVLALGAQPTSDTQTIILIPHNFTSTCQPTLFIGKDSNNYFYGLTYVIKNSAGGVPCCTEGEEANPCAIDSLYTWQMADGSAAQVPTGQPGRIKVTITPDTNSPQVGVLSGIQILPGLWWPGQQDFTS